jgi:hypothetical protein
MSAPAETVTTAAVFKKALENAMAKPPGNECANLYSFAPEPMLNAMVRLSFPGYDFPSRELRTKTKSRLM